MSEIGLGLWSVPDFEWGPGNDADVMEAIEAALDGGVTFFDTADIYGHGRSEELLGRAMAGRRERFVVATKIGWDGFDGEAQRSRYDTVAKLTAGVETSLSRLSTDYVDLRVLRRGACAAACTEAFTTMSRRWDTGPGRGSGGTRRASGSG